MRSPDTKLTFGCHEGLTLRQVPTDYLKWLVSEISNPEIAHNARLVLAERASSGEEDLESQADAFLMAHGVNPKKYHVGTKFQGRR